MSVTPDFVGQRYKDTNTGNIWIANSTTPGDWTLEVQNMQVKWSPISDPFTAKIGLFTFGSSSGTGAIILEHSSSVPGFDFTLFQDITSISFPNLVSIDPANTQSGYLSITSCPSLLSISCPALITAGSLTLQNNVLLATIALPLFTGTTGSIPAVSFSGNVSLVNLSLPSLTTVDSDFSAQNCTALANVSVPLYVPTNGQNINFSGCALTDISVNHLLARCVANAAYVSGGIDLSGGTSSSPTGQGILDKATLNGRLAGLAVTN